MGRHRLGTLILRGDHTRAGWDMAPEHCWQRVCAPRSQGARSGVPNRTHPALFPPTCGSPGALVAFCPWGAPQTFRVARCRGAQRSWRARAGTSSPRKRGKGGPEPLGCAMQPAGPGGGAATSPLLARRTKEQFRSCGRSCY